MRNIKFTLGVICCIFTFILASCSDEEVEKSSKQVSETWSLDKYKSKSVHPGDNFRAYCLANLIDTFQVASGGSSPIFQEASEELWNRFSRIAGQQPELWYLYEKYSYYETDVPKADSVAVAHFYGRIDTILKAKSMTDAYNLFALNLKRGSLCDWNFFYPNNQAKLYFFFMELRTHQVNVAASLKWRQQENVSKMIFGRLIRNAPAESRTGKDYKTEIANMPIFKQVFEKASLRIDQCYTELYGAYDNFKTLNDMDLGSLKLWMALSMIEKEFSYLNRNEKIAV